MQITDHPAQPDKQAHILVEQLRLIYASTTLSILPMFPAVALLVWTLINDANSTRLLAWAAFVTLANLYSLLHARHQLARGFTAQQTLRLVKQLIVSVGVGGASWGALAFGALGNTTAVGDIIVICVLSGILGGSVGLLSPVLPVFVAFSVPLVSLTTAKLWQLDDPAYGAFGVISLIYLGVLIAQTRNSSRATRAAIVLRFENLELVEQANAARRDAEQANTDKSRFLAAASHDLRQPVHAQGLFLDVLARTPLNAQQKDLVNNINATCAASAEMLNILLDFSRIDAGVVKPQLQAFRLQGVLNKIEREFEPQADAKGLSYHSRETPLSVLSDPSLVELILRNLVSNAIRYTDHGGLLVACRKRGEQAVLEVWDTGIGIAPDQQAEIFKEFHQLGNPERDRHKGLGLGLAIVQGLCKTLGHELRVQSQLGRGSIFRLALPLATSHVALNPTAAALSTQTLMDGTQVLVIDDDEIVLSGMAQLLREWGCQVNTASSIEQALQLAQEQAPDVVISDYRLRSQGNGAHAISQVRQLVGKSIPALLITGDTAPERLREALGAGVPLVHKPLAPDDLYKALLKQLEGKQA